MCNTFILFMILHLTGDFYFQTDKISYEKKEKIKSLIIHIFLYIIPFLLLFLLNDFKTSVLLILLSFICHLTIDIIKYILLSKINKINELTIFIVDQLLHITSLLLIVLLLKINYEFPFSSLILKWILVVMLIIKPASILIQKILCSYNILDDNTSNKAGRKIGILERLITIIFLGIGQFSIIG